MLIYSLELSPSPHSRLNDEIDWKEISCTIRLRSTRAQRPRRRIAFARALAAYRGQTSSYSDWNWIILRAAVVDTNACRLARNMRNMYAIDDPWERLKSDLNLLADSTSLNAHLREVIFVYRNNNEIFFPHLIFEIAYRKKTRNLTAQRENVTHFYYKRNWFRIDQRIRE